MYGKQYQEGHIDYSKKVFCTSKSNNKNISVIRKRFSLRIYLIKYRQIELSIIAYIC